MKEKVAYGFKNFYVRELRSKFQRTNGRIPCALEKVVIGNIAKKRIAKGEQLIANCTCRKAL